MTPLPGGLLFCFFLPYSISSFKMSATLDYRLSPSIRLPSVTVSSFRSRLLQAATTPTRSLHLHLPVRCSLRSGSNGSAASLRSSQRRRATGGTTLQRQPAGRAARPPSSYATTTARRAAPTAWRRRRSSELWRDDDGAACDFKLARGGTRAAVCIGTARHG